VSRRTPPVITIHTGSLAWHAVASEHQTGGHRSADDLVVGLTGARFGGAAGRRRRAAAPEDDAGTTHHHRGERPPVGQTGARFSPILKRWRTKKEDTERPESASANSEGTAKATGMVTGLHQERLILLQEITTETATPEAEPSRLDWTDWEAVPDSNGLVRPYFWTGGRTSSRFELSFETLISATGQPVDPTAPPEHHTILRLCDAPRSVAELAALLSMPLGVARVILGDMAEVGSVAVHRTIGSADAAPDLELMRRVLNGLQRL
jgi:Protein of unknown function (DUF742)